MDENKRQKLHDIGYTIAPCCGICANGFIKSGTDWGVCTVKAHEYEHLKHTDSRRALSIHRLGCCGDDNFILGIQVTRELGKFFEFCESS